MELKILREKVKKEYFAINRVFSPAISEYVYFTSEGYHHLTYKNQLKGRSKIEKTQRLTHFKYVRNLLQLAVEVKELRTVIYKRNYSITFLALEENITSSIRIRVVIKQYNNTGKYIFLSVIPIMKKC